MQCGKLVLATTTALCLAAAFAASASADNFWPNANWVGYDLVRVTCHTNRAGLVWAGVSARMNAHNSGRYAHQANNMRIKSRLVSATSHGGLSD